MAFTNVLPGSTRYPDLRLRWAPTTQPTAATQTYVDITDRLRGWDWGYGRNDELATFEAGTGSVLLDNRDRAFDPSFGEAVALTVSGNEITDASRALNVQGDGRSADSSFGIHEATTNLVTNGGFETNTTGWFANGSGSTLALDTIGKVFGQKSLQVTNGAGIPQAATNPSSTVVAASPVTVSMWVSGTGTAQPGAIERTGADVFVANRLGSVVNLSATPQRISVTYTPAAGNTLVRALVLGSAAGTLYVDGVQVENQPLATPYVHTDGATATRAAARVQAPASLLDETQGWVAFRLRPAWASTTDIGQTVPRVFHWADGDPNEISLFFRESTNVWELQRDGAGVSGTRPTVAATHAAGEAITLIAAWTATQLKISLNGAAFTASTQSNIPVLAATQFDIGRATDWAGVTQFIDADYLWFACGTGTLTDTDAATIHAYGNTDPDTGTLPTTAAATAAWPADTATASTGSHYAGNIKPRKVFELVAKWATVEYPVFVAYARGFPQSYPAAGFDNVVKVDLVDAFAILQGVDLIVGFSRPAELSGTRITAVLDAIGVPAALRDIDAGTVIVDALTITTTGTSGLAHAKEVALASEMGQLFVARDGKVTFHDYSRRLNAASMHTFSDAAGAPLSYTSLEPAFDETYLWNYVRVTGADGDEAAALTENAASQADYFKLTKTISTQLLTGSDIEQVAQRYALRYSQPELRAPSLALNGAGNAAARWPVILDLEVSDRITVNRFASEADPMSLVQSVEGIRHACVPGGPWSSSIVTSPADTRSYFVLDDPVRGQLDSGNVLA